MKKQLYTVGAAAFALAMSGMPALALAENENASAKAQGSVEMQATGVSVGAGVAAQVKAGDDNENAADEEGNGVQVQERDKVQSRIEAEDGSSDGAEIRERARFMFSLGSTTIAASLDDLKKSIEMRKQELDDEEMQASSSIKAAIQNANPVRLAVHTLLASKDLLGGIGQQVSIIAQQMNDTVATTSAAEAKIESRGFFARLFFGGDKTSAEAIQSAVAQNQERIQALVELMNQANISVELKTTLEAQVKALEEAQVRLQELAQKEQGSWGLFSWRF